MGIVVICTQALCLKLVIRIYFFHQVPSSEKHFARHKLPCFLFKTWRNSDRCDDQYCCSNHLHHFLGYPSLAYHIPLTVVKEIKISVVQRIFKYRSELYEKKNQMRQFIFFLIKCIIHCSWSFLSQLPALKQSFKGLI